MNHSLEITEEELVTRLEQGTLAFGIEVTEDSEAESWANATRGDSQVTKTDISDMEESASVIPELKFEVVYARTVESPKKHVAYTVMVRKDGAVPDPHPSVIERRYTEFLELYIALRQENPSLLSTFAFPKKALRGNFTPEMISSRSAGFEAFLMLIAANEKLRNSAAVTEFLQHREQAEIRHWIEEKRYDQAVPLLENCFRLLNKLHTDRHPAVLRTLCLLVACCEAGNDKQTERFAEIALRRYEAVSDADLLQYYVPLLQLCVHHYWSTGKDKHLLEERLGSLKKRGIRVEGRPSLLSCILADV